VDTILPRLRDCRSADDVRRIVHEEFVKWFDVVTAGPPEKYQTVAKRIWEEVVPGLTGSMRGRTTRWTWRVGLSLAAQRAYRLRQGRLSMKNDEIQYRWEHCEPIEGVAFLANDRAVVIDEFRGAIAATVLALRAIDAEPAYELVLDAGGERLFRRQSALVSPAPENMGECVAWIQKWYSAQCDGEWEHDLGVAIGTLDNPGWSVRLT
jgi:hypothetical protein